MTARTPMEQIEDARKQIWETAHDHADALSALVVLGALRDACELVARHANEAEDDAFRAALLHPQWGVPAYLADAAGDVAQFFTTWDDRRADRAQEAEDNRAADAADARIAL